MNLALYPPPNYERLPPDKITRENFERWVCYACVEFPNELEAAARYALDEVQGLGFQGRPFQNFIKKYTEWYALPEDEKERLMSPARSESPRRGLYRRRARFG